MDVMFKVNADLKQAEAAVWVTEISGEAPAQVVWLFQRRMIGDLQDLIDLMVVLWTRSSSLT